MDSERPTVWPAPAKLNLLLRVVGRRADGYHELQTLFHLIDVADELTFEPTPDPAIVLPAPIAGVAYEQNLVVRAARALQAETGCTQGACIGVRKRIPMGGGLGGGSSDAATTLHALNHLWKTGLRDDELARIGVTLGADVPVFVRGESAWAEGVGERLTPVCPPPAWYLVVHPGCHVPTPEIFNAPELTRNSPRMTIPRLLLGRVTDPGPAEGDDASSADAARRLLALAGNDFEPVVRGRYAAVDEAFGWLSSHATPHLTGTGAAVFAVFDSERAARAAAQTAPAGWWWAVARGLHRSPLRVLIERLR